MSKTLTTGSTIQVASTFGTGFTISAISNATDAVATLSSSHGVIVGDYIHIQTSGWARAVDRVFRVSAVSTNDVTLEDFNTSDTNAFPAGTGAGTGREITAWTEVPQVQSASSSGGDLSFADATTLADNEQRQVPTTRSAVQYNLTCFDDPSLSGFTAVQTASDSRSVYPLRINFSNGSKAVAGAYWNLQKTPNLAPNALLTVNVGISLASEPTRYAS